MLTTCGAPVITSLPTVSAGQFEQPPHVLDLRRAMLCQPTRHKYPPAARTIASTIRFCQADSIDRKTLQDWIAESRQIGGSRMPIW
jgi:hypothetical protein